MPLIPDILCGSRRGSHCAGFHKSSLLLPPPNQLFAPSVPSHANTSSPDKSFNGLLRKGVQKNVFWEIFPKCGWVRWLIPKQGPNPPFVFPNLTKTLGWMGG